MENAGILIRFPSAARTNATKMSAFLMIFRQTLFDIIKQKKGA